MAELLTAPASEKPCELHKYHWPPVLETEGHHIYPVYLQNRKYGKIVKPDLVWSCGTGHTNIHGWIAWLLGERRKAPWRRGTRTEMQYVYTAVDWFESPVEKV